MLRSQLAYPILKLYKVAMVHDSISLYLRKVYFFKVRYKMTGFHPIILHTSTSEIL